MSKVIILKNEKEKKREELAHAIIKDEKSTIYSL